MSNFLSAADIAEEYNLWIRFDGYWQTPKQFRGFVNERMINSPRDRILILSPLKELERGRWIIIEMVRRKEDPQKIEKAIIKMSQFETRIRQEYKESGWTRKVSELPGVIEKYYQQFE